MRRTLRGILRTVILDIIARQGPIYGLEIVREVERVSGDEKIVLTAGSLYPALHSFEQNGLVQVETRPTPRGRGAVNYYSITEKGRRELTAQREEVKTLFKFGQAVLEL